MHAHELVRMITAGRGICGPPRCCGRAGPLPKPEHQVRRPIRGRKRDRYARQTAWKQRVEVARSDRDRREHRRRQRHPGGAGRRAVGSDGYTIFITSNTTHASNQSMLKKRSLRCGRRFRADHEAGNHHACAGRPPVGSGQHRPGAHRLRQGQSRQADVRLRLDVIARGRRAVEDHGRHRHAACAVHAAIHWW